MDRKSITVVVVVMLCAGWFAYSFGWFDGSGSGTDMQSNTVSADQALDQTKTNSEAVPVTQKAAPADAAAE